MLLSPPSLDKSFIVLYSDEKKMELFLRNRSKVQLSKLNERFKSCGHEKQVGKMNREAM